MFSFTVCAEKFRGYLFMETTTASCIASHKVVFPSFKFVTAIAYTVTPIRLPFTSLSSLNLDDRESTVLFYFVIFRQFS